MVTHVEAGLRAAILRSSVAEQVCTELDWEACDEVARALYFCDLLGPSGQEDQLKITRRADSRTKSAFVLGRSGHRLSLCLACLRCGMAPLLEARGLVQLGPCQAGGNLWK